MKKYKEGIEMLAAICSILGITVFGGISFLLNKSETTYGTTASVEEESEASTVIASTLEPETATTVSDISESEVSNIPEAELPTIAPSAPEAETTSTVPSTKETDTSVSGPEFSDSVSPETCPGGPDAPESYTARVPSVIDMYLDEAWPLLLDRGFFVNICFESEEPCYPEDLSTYSAVVIDQSDIDEILEAGSIIDLYVQVLEDYTDEDESVLEEYVEVPDVIGLLQEDATELLSNLGFIFQVWWYEEDFSDDSDELIYVIEQSLEPGISVKKGCKIRLHISDSIETADEISDYTIVPSVTGCTQDEAVELLSEADLDYQVWWYEGDISGNENDTPYVAEQSISGGTEVKKGTLIELHLYTK